MTVKELEKVIGGTISRSIASEYIKAVNELINEIISYIDATSADEMLKSMEKIPEAYENAVELIDKMFNEKSIDINEHLRLYRYATRIFKKYVMNLEKMSEMEEDFKALLIDEEDTGENIQKYITKEQIKNMKVGDKIVFTSESGTKFRIKKTNETERCFAFYNITNKKAICSMCKIDYILTTTVY